MWLASLDYCIKLILKCRLSKLCYALWKSKEVCYFYNPYLFCRISTAWNNKLIYLQNRCGFCKVLGLTYFISPLKISLRRFQKRALFVIQDSSICSDTQRMWLDVWLTKSSYIILIDFKRHWAWTWTSCTLEDGNVIRYKLNIHNFNTKTFRNFSYQKVLSIFVYIFYKLVLGVNIVNALFPRAFILLQICNVFAVFNL